MTSGRKPEPTAKKAIKGTLRPSRRRNEPVCDGKRPTAPEWLDETALDEWDRVIGVLTIGGVVGTCDRTVLAGYCQAWSDYIAALEQVRAEGMVIETQSGYKQPHPMVAIMNKAWDRCLKAAQELGMTPSSRTKLNVNGEVKKDSGRLKYVSA